MSSFSAAEHLSAALAESVVTVVEALREICATLGIIKSLISYLQIRIAERRAIGFAAPYSFVSINQRISFSCGQIKNECIFRQVRIPFSSRLPRKTSESTNDIVRLCENNC